MAAALSLRASLLRMALGSGLAVLALVLLVEGLVLIGASEVTNDYVRNFMRGTVDLLVRDLTPLDPPTRRQRLQELDAQFNYPVRLTDAAQERLSAEQRARLARGEVIVTGLNRRIYAALPGEPDQLLLLGPLDTRRAGELPKELAAQLAVAVVLALGVALIAWWQLRPLWRDLRGLQRAAERLSAGKLDTELPPLRSGLFAPVVAATRSMLERLASAMATQRELSGAVSHELRTPLARLRFAVDALVEEDDRAAREQAVLACERDIDELDELIDASLTLARLDMGAIQPHLASGDVGALLAHEARSLAPLLDGKALETDLRLSGPVRFDERLLPYAVRNGLRNAARHARGRILLSAWVEAGQLWLAIDDDGEGVAPALREAAFEPFKRLERVEATARKERLRGAARTGASPIKPGARGFGLGLAIVRHVAQAHGGQARLGEAPRLGGARLLLHWPAA